MNTPHGRPENVVEIEPDGPITVLNGDKQTRLTSVDDYDLFYHLPGGIHGKTLVSTLHIYNPPPT